MLLEKPVSGDVKSAMQLVERRREQAGVPILVGHHRRHSLLIQRASEIVGRAASVRSPPSPGCACFSSRRTISTAPSAWRREPGGGIVLINLIHVIDDLRNICGDIVAIQAAESNAARGFPVEDTAAMILHFANGALGTLNISDAANAPWSWELTAGENKVYPQTDQFCYLFAGTGGSLTVPRLDVWRHQRRRLVDADRGGAAHRAGAGPAHRANAPFLRSDPGEAKPMLDGRVVRGRSRRLGGKKAAETGGMVRLS